MSDEVEDQKEKVSRRSGFSMLVISVLLIGLGAAGGVYTVQQKPEWFSLSKGQAQVQAEADKLVADVGKLINLPGDEKPTIATVSDASKIKDQPFFQAAQNGDKVLIYQKAAKAVLFRPSENRIIEVGAVNINNQALPSPQASPVASPQASPEPETN